jgi:hypothetical protein
MEDDHDAPGEIGAKGGITFPSFDPVLPEHIKRLRPGRQATFNEFEIVEPKIADETLAIEDSNRDGDNGGPDRRTLGGGRSRK